MGKYKVFKPKLTNFIKFFPIMPITPPYFKAVFSKSVATKNQLPKDEGFEVAFAGRSNSGKSSALNCLTGIKKLAYTSKTPGRTQLINFFNLDDAHRLVDLPGYGYAAVPFSIKEAWQRNLSNYIQNRQCLKGLVLLMDCRHPLKVLDEIMIDMCLERELPIHILLTKVDKLSHNLAKNTFLRINKQKQLKNEYITIQNFSSFTKEGLDELISRLNQWFLF